MYETYFEPRHTFSKSFVRWSTPHRRPILTQGVLNILSYQIRLLEILRGFEKCFDELSGTATSSTSLLVSAVIALSYVSVIVLCTRKGEN